MTSTSRLERRPFWYLRHGQTDWNARHLAQGCTDIPLNETGLEQADGAGRLLAERFGGEEVPFTHIVASPLVRAHETARRVREVVQTHPALQGRTLPLTCEGDLREVSFGLREGHPMGDWYDAWISGTFTPEQGESFADLRHRAIAGVNRAVLASEGTPLIVAHGALFRALRHAMGLKANVRLPNAVPVLMRPSEDGSWEVEGLD